MKYWKNIQNLFIHSRYLYTYEDFYPIRLCMSVFTGVSVYFPLIDHFGKNIEFFMSPYGRDGGLRIHSEYMYE